MAYALGIDIGTTYTAAALWREGRAETVPLGDRAHSIPSALFLRDDGVMLVGEAANRRGTTDPNRIAREFKRRLGDDAPLLLGEAEVSAQELTGYLLRWVVDKVAEREGARPDHVTLTCPATWGVYRRHLMTEAAATARLTGVGLVPEPVAAAVYYASQERLDVGALVAIYDLGGGTFDATVVRKTETGFDICGTPGGDETIGGTDFDQVVMDHVAVTLGVHWAALDTDDPVVLAGLSQVRDHAVEAKEALSSDVEATIPVILPDLTRDVRITRGEFEAGIRIPVLRTIDTLAQTLSAAQVEPADLHAILLVGGSSRIPLVSRLIASELGVPVAVDAHPKYAVCLGAVISAGPRLAEVSGGPSAAGDALGAELLAPEPAAVAVDLASSGISEPLDVLLRPVPNPARALPELTARDEPLTITHTGDVRRGGRMALLVSAAAVVLVVAASVLSVVAQRQPSEPTGTATTRSATPSPPTTPAGPAATMQAQPVPQKPGEVMRAVTAAAGGGLLAVGESVTDGEPRTWRFGSGRWSAATQPRGRTAWHGGMNGVAMRSGSPTRYVAVGWVASKELKAPTGSVRKAAIWYSDDGGATWHLVPESNMGLGPATNGPRRLGELYDVVLRPGGGFLATGVDWSVDPDGDGAVLASSDGSRWLPVIVRGLDGPGPATLRRLLPGSGTDVLAVGTRLEGAVSRSVIWRSPDLRTWSEVAPLDAAPAPGTAWGVTRAADGSLLVMGFASALDRTSTPVLWTGRTAAALRSRPVSGTEGKVYGITAATGTVTAVGERQSGDKTVPSAWTVRLP